MDLGLKDRVYIVTGATRGLGNATARSLAADGAKLIITGRDEKSVVEAAAELGPDAVGLAADNADPSAAQRLVDTARDRFGRLDGILISVGGPAPASSRTTRTTSGRRRSRRCSWERYGSPERRRRRSARAA